MNKPEILFLDEPTTGLDPQVRAHVLDVVSNLRSSGTTIFMTTHYMEEAERLCDRVAVIDRGRIIACASPAALIRKHFEYTRVELSSSTLSHGELAGVPLVDQMKTVDDGFVLYTKRPTEVVGTVWQMAKSIGADVSDLRIRRASLEDVFIQLTGRPIRD